MEEIERRFKEEFGESLIERFKNFWTIKSFREHWTGFRNSDHSGLQILCLFLAIAYLFDKINFLQQINLYKDQWTFYNCFFLSLKNSTYGSLYNASFNVSAIP